ncbi:hypothetical protein F4821DRAFT_273635 [Hypoxylon rubiginosum]|uniref:Uncharacterized protein n=1 Tax=Hypoxylon rubiginosum TaxID=110542 RepID=A0ACC0CJW3_9PEZI|nr:hypothetical protein F4821DRAFT_273635 [Hypoxylon rubiginosum]
MKKSIVKKASFIRVYFLVVHILLLVLIAVIWIYHQDIMSIAREEERSWSPVQKFVEYEVREAGYFRLTGDEELAGPPTHEQDRAWDNLIRPAYFNASLEELDKAGETLENLTELTSGGYLSSIGVYHELHCLRQLRLYLFKERYYPNLTEYQEETFHSHLDHCLEALRETIMCNGNTAMLSFFWESPHALQPIPRSNGKSVCVRWNSVERWGYSRMIATNPDYKRPESN